MNTGLYELPLVFFLQFWHKVLSVLGLFFTFVLLGEKK